MSSILSRSKRVRSFVKLYLLRYDWIKDLINETGRVDDDFRREVDDKLKMNLFPELEVPPSVQIQVGDQILNPVIENIGQSLVSQHVNLKSRQDTSVHLIKSIEIL